MKKNYIDHIDKIMQRADEKLGDLADEYRNKVLIPLCNKHELNFFSGNGRIFFTDHMGNDITETKFKTPHLDTIFETLNHDIGYNNVFGYYVFPITKKDLK